MPRFITTYIEEVVVIVHYLFKALFG